MTRHRDIEYVDSLADTRHERECPACEDALDETGHHHHGRMKCWTPARCNPGEPR